MAVTVGNSRKLIRGTGLARYPVHSIAGRKDNCAITVVAHTNKLAVSKGKSGKPILNP
jgi:hypothetical protein